MLAASDGESRTAMLAGFASHAQDMTFATQLLYRLRDGSQNAGKALIWLEGELEKRGSDSEEIIVGEHRNLSTGNVTMGNIVRGLRLVNDVDWTMWFETVSRIDEVLREKTDFASLDFYSRDQYRTAIEELARRSEKSEFEVTLKAIGLAADAASPKDGAPDIHSDVGFFLVGNRRQELEAEIGYVPSIGKRIARLLQRSAGSASCCRCLH